MLFDLTKYIKYCLGYVRLTAQKSFSLQQKYTIHLPKENFNLLGLLNGETDGSSKESISLDTFYAYDPKKVPKELEALYQKEKALAEKIEEIYSKYKNDPYTKQIILNFGFFNIEVPIIEDDVLLNDEDEDLEKKDTTQLDLPLKTKEIKFPLFSIPILINKEIEEGIGKYLLFAVDPEFHVNISVLENVLGEDLYYQLIEEFGLMEVEGRFILPVTSFELFNEIWQKIKAQLRLREASFDENSFSIEEVNVSLAPKVNYFLAEDLEKLAKLDPSKLENTSLTSWGDNADINNYDSDADTKESDIYFPFQYDKFKLKVLAIINNKASVVQGPPGTGKSETIANLLCHLAAKGKKVLFVSQKAQALKVVKDKLKKLNVSYLSGYIPNLNSLQLNEEDEVDGIAIQLSALDGHIEKLTYAINEKSSNNNHSLESIETEKIKLRDVLSKSYEEERKLYKATSINKALAGYNLGQINKESFEKSFDSSLFNQTTQILKDIDNLGITTQESALTIETQYFNEKFQKVLGRRAGYVNSLELLKNDYQKTGYDRHNSTIRTINNGIRGVKLIRDLSKLPREVIDYINTEINKDISRSEGVSTLDKIVKYFSYCASRELLQSKIEEASSLLLKAGLFTADQHKLIIQILSKNPDLTIEQIKGNIIKFYETDADIKSFRNDANTNHANNVLNNVSSSRTQVIARYIQNIINQRFINRWKKDATLRQITKKLGKAFGKSKKAFKTFDNLRSDPTNFKTILDLIPVWIMELDDASRIVPLEANIFDYVILDEASQCNVAYTLPVMFRAGKTLFFGDSEQMRDSTILFKSNKAFDELARRYQVPEELRIKTSGSAVQSVLDIASLRGFLSIPLRYHYRSPKELIGFSNKYFYKPKGKELIPLNNNYLTYKDTSRVMIIHKINADSSVEISDKINIAEAYAILNLFKELKSDSRYASKSIGILCFFNAQATYLRSIFEKEGFKEDELNYKISIIEGIQGDEKDIVIYSFVIRSPDQVRQYYPLTGEGGDIRGDINKGRVNVAFSRARQQVHCFVSMAIVDIPDRIWIKKYLEYVQDNGKVDSCSIELRPFDSYFEEEFYSLLKIKLGSDFLLQNQVPSCGFKIDFVVTNLKTERKLAIECDGPCHFKNESDEEFGYYIESDEERQRVLEAAGWEFHRIKYSEWIQGVRPKNHYIEEIIKKFVSK